MTIQKDLLTIHVILKTVAVFWASLGRFLWPKKMVFLLTDMANRTNFNCLILLALLTFGVSTLGVSDSTLRWFHIGASSRTGPWTVICWHYCMYKLCYTVFLICWSTLFTNVILFFAPVAKLMEDWDKNICKCWFPYVNLLYETAVA